MANAKPQFTFLEEVIVEILKENGFENLTDEQKKTLLPQFVAHAEVRLGAAVMPLLNEASANQLAALAEKPKTSSAEWLKFWTDSIPNFEEVVKEVLQNYAVELGQIFAKV